MKFQQKLLMHASWANQRVIEFHREFSEEELQFRLTETAMTIDELVHHIVDAVEVFCNWISPGVIANSVEGQSGELGERCKKAEEILISESSKEDGLIDFLLWGER